MNYLSKFIPTQARFSTCEEFDYLYIMHANIPNVFKKLPMGGGCGQCQTVDYDTTKFVLPDFRRMVGARAVTGR